MTDRAVLSAAVLPTGAPELEHPYEARMYAALRVHAPDLAGQYLTHLPRARTLTTARLLAALWREDVAGLRGRGVVVRDGGPAFTRIQPGPWIVTELPGAGSVAFPVRGEHAFERVDPGHPVLHLDPGRPTPVPLAHPTALVALLSVADPGPAWAGLATELADAVANLALALARAEQSAVTLRRDAAALGAADCVDLARIVAARDGDSTVFLERLSTDGHNLHPCARTRLGMFPTDLLRHDLEAAEPTGLALVGIRRDHAESAGADIGEVLLGEFPRLAAAVCAAGLDRGEYLFVPVHEWQLRKVVATRYAREICDGLIVPIPAARLRAEPTMALRTLLTEPGESGRRIFVKAALDIQVTSTRRTISVHTTANGPEFSRVLDRIVAAEPALTGRVLLMSELAGAGFASGGFPSRDLSALLREGLTDRLAPGEVAVPGCALYARSPVTGRTVLAELVDRYVAQSRGVPLDFLAEYATLLLTPTITLMTGYGLGLEAHLQNTVPTFVDGVPTRMAFRDWGGMRVYLPRLAASGHRAVVRPGSVTVAGDVNVMRAKVAYTALQNHLGEVVARLATSHGVPEPDAWQRVGAVLRGIVADLAARPRLRAHAEADGAALFASRLPHKALLAMRLSALGGTASLPASDRDRYVDVPNPLLEAP